MVLNHIKITFHVCVFWMCVQHTFFALKWFEVILIGHKEIDCI